MIVLHALKQIKQRISAPKLRYGLEQYKRPLKYKRTLAESKQAKPDSFASSDIAKSLTQSFGAKRRVYSGDIVQTELCGEASGGLLMQETVREGDP